MSNTAFGSDRAFDELLSFVAHQRGALRSDRDVFVEAMVLARSERFYMFASVCAEAKPMPSCKRMTCKSYTTDPGGIAICDCCGQQYCTHCDLLIADPVPSRFYEDEDSSSDYVE